MLLWIFPSCNFCPFLRRETVRGDMTFCRILSGLVAVCLLGNNGSASENPVFRELTERGVELSTGARVKVPQPTMSDGLSREEQQEIIRQVSKYSLSSFLRKSTSAPFVLKRESIRDKDGERVGHQVDLWFVAYASLETFTDEELRDEIEMPTRKTAGDLPAEGRELTPGELHQRGLKAESSEKVKEGYSYFNQPVLDKVQVRGVIYSVLNVNPNSIVTALKLDDRFADDPELPNQWRPIDRDDRGNVRFGGPRPYAGYGMYAKVTPLVDESGNRTGALFIECHLAFNEPKEWFGGANLIGSKLGVIVRDRVPDFRRELQRAEERREQKLAESAR
jgi:hypothetical protein